MVVPLSDFLSGRGEGAFLTAGLTLPAAGIILGHLLLPLLRREWAEFNAVEDSGREGHDNRRSRVAVRVVSRISLLALASLVSFVLLAFAAAPSLGFFEGVGPVEVRALAAAIVAVLVVAGGALWAFTRHRATVPDTLLVGWGLFCFAAATALTTIVFASGPTPAVWLALAQAAIVVGWQVEALMGNALMRGIDVSMTRLVACAFGYATLIAALFLYVSSVGERNAAGGPAFAGWAVLHLAVSIAITMLVAYTTGRLVDPPGIPQPGNSRMPDEQAARQRLGDDVAHYRLASGILQDTGLMALLSAGLIWMSAMTFAHIRDSAPERLSAIAALLLSIFIFFTSSFTWTLRNNLENADRFRRWYRHLGPTSAWLGLLPNTLRHSAKTYRAAFARPGRPLTEPERRARFSEVLDAHITNQNLFALVLLAVSYVGSLGLVNELGGDSTTPAPPNAGR